MTTIIKKVTHTASMTDLYWAYNHSLHCAGDWKDGYSQVSSKITQNCSSLLHFQWGLDMHRVPARSFLPQLVSVFEALPALHLPCAVSLAGEVIPCRVGHIPFFQSLELLHSSARAVKIFFNIRESSHWYKFYCLTVFTEPTEGIMPNLSKHSNVIHEQ